MATALALELHDGLLGGDDHGEARGLVVTTSIILVNLLSEEEA